MMKEKSRKHNHKPDISLFKDIVNLSFDAVLLLDSGGIIIYANKAAEDLFRSGKHGMAGEKFTYSPVDGNTVELETERDKKKHVLKMKVQRISRQSDEYHLVSLRDITEQMKTLREWTWLDRAIRDAAQGVVITNESGIIQYINPAFETITGFQRQELLDVHITKFRTPDNKNNACEVLWEKREADRQWRGRILWCNKKKESLEIEALISPIHNTLSEPSGYIIWVRDITNELKMVKQLHQSQKLEAIRTLAGGIAHNFNNILMAIIGYTDMTLNKYQENKEIQFNLTNVLNAGYRARDLVNQILTFSKQHEEEKKAINPLGVLKEALQFLRASLPASINIVQSVSPDIKNILADHTQFYQIIMNLCTNAAEAMQEKGGELKVVLSNTFLDQHFVRQNPETQPGAYVKLIVSDTGCGISPEIIDNIFEPYFTTKNNGKASGLGLAVVHGILKSYHGSITVSSTPGAGTVFTLYLPALSSPELHNENRLYSSRGIERVLFVDDEEILVELGKRMLTSLGYRVITTTDSLQALDFFRKDPTQFDLVITDLTMPNLSGIEFTKAVLSLCPHIPVILCTGYHEKIAEDKAQSLGIKAFISKPLVMNELGTTIRKVMAKGILHG